MSTRVAIKASNKDGGARIENTSVPIYRPGKKPEQKDRDDGDGGLASVIRNKLKKKAAKGDRKRGAVNVEIAKPKAAVEGKKVKAAQVKAEMAEVIDEEEPAEILEEQDDVGARVLEVENPEEDDVQDMRRDDDDDRRARLRAKLLSKRRQEEELMADEEGEQEEQQKSESESEYETDTSDSEYEPAPLLKPVFVPKAKRDTVEEQKKLAEKEAQATKKREERAKERKLQSRQLVESGVKADIEQAQAAKEEAGSQSDVSSSDEGDVNDEEEYELWKVRELNRIKSAKEEKETYLKEQAELERRRTMTDAQIMLEDKANELKNPAPKTKYKYLQKYYHMGAFYKDLDESHQKQVLERDYNKPTGDDAHDKSILPKVMQVRNFGRSGRTKWTHLTNEDTTAVDYTPWQETSILRSKYDERTAGRGGFVRPSGKKHTV